MPNELQNKTGVARGLNSWGREPDEKPKKQKTSPGDAAFANVNAANNNTADVSHMALDFFHSDWDSAKARLDKMTEFARTRGMTRQEAINSACNLNTDLSTLPEVHLQDAYFTPPSGFNAPKDLRGLEEYIRRSLVRSGSYDSIDVFEQKLALSHVDHAAALHKLRRSHPALFGLLIDQYPTRALQLAKELGAGAVELLRSLTIDHVLTAFVATGHFRVAQLRIVATAPLEGLHASDNEWHSKGAVARNYREIARAIYPIYTESFTSVDSEEKIAAILDESKLFSSKVKIKEFIDYCKHIESTQPISVRNGSNFDEIYNDISKKVYKLSKSKDEDFKEAGWNRLTFAEERYGVRASQGVIVVAANLLCGRQRIEACVDAILEDKPLPVFSVIPRMEELPNRPLAALTSTLRVEGQPDKNAPKEMLDEANNTSKKLVMKFKKLHKAVPFEKAFKRLHIDPSFYFAR